MLKKFILGDMAAVYNINPEGLCGFSLIPASASEDEIDLTKNGVEPLCQIYITGDKLPGGFAAGLSMRDSDSLWRFKYKAQKADTVGNTTEIITTLASASGVTIDHILSYKKTESTVSIHTVLSNGSNEPVSLDMLSSFTLGYISPYKCGDESLTFHRALSAWSAEGRIHSDDIEDLSMEESWSGFGSRLFKMSQTGSMPVRKNFPFAAITDNKSNVTWAVMLACSSSWQLELARCGKYLSLSGGISDFETGHFRKIIAADTKFETPCAFLTVAEGGLDCASQRLSDTFSRRHNERHPEPMPVVFNEFCSSWGVPEESDIAKTAAALRGHGVKYFVIDAGWYAPKHGQWYESNGDWDVSEKLFPHGMKATADNIKSDGMIPGIWFELETCAQNSRIYNNRDMLLTREGTPIGVGIKHFLDMRKDCTKKYLGEKVIDFLRDNGFGYMKVDYNDSLGIGCDGADSLGSGLYDNIEASKDFFRSVYDAIPGIILENCASGGHRLEPSLLSVFDYASFSDAHECVEIPIIAANLHRLMAPPQEQIWAVLRASDTPQRTAWSLINTFFGMMCLSGDISSLSQAQWKQIDSAIAFYNSISDIIKLGKTRFYGSGNKKYRSPEGWQAIVRTDSENKNSYALIHVFGGKAPDKIEIPVGDNAECVSVYGAGGFDVQIKDSILTITGLGSFEAAAVKMSNN